MNAKRWIFFMHLSFECTFNRLVNKNLFSIWEFKTKQFIAKKKHQKNPIIPIPNIIWMINRFSSSFISFSLTIHNIYKTKNKHIFFELWKKLWVEIRDSEWCVRDLQLLNTCSHFYSHHHLILFFTHGKFS